MKQNHHPSPPAYDRTEDIRREAERAIRECDTAADLTDRILSQPIADRLVFIDRAEAYYTRLLSLRQREALVDHFDQREPKYGDLTCYFRSHREEANREQSSHEIENRPHIKPTDAAQRIALQKKASEPKQSTPNTQINMTINNYGGTQNIFEAGATQHIERLICTSAPEEEKHIETADNADFRRTSNEGEEADSSTRPDGANPQELHGKEPLPAESNYVMLARWLRNQTEAGRDRLAEAGGNVSLMARQLSEELGWAVDDCSLRRAIARGN